MVMHAATTILDDIIDELQLKYDSLIGLLDGDAIREIPSLATLQNLNKLLGKLAKSLEATEAKDTALLENIQKRLETLDSEGRETQDQSVEAEAAETPVKRERPDEDAAMDDESVPLAKRRKHVEVEESVETEAAEPQEMIETQDAPEADPPINSSDDPVPPVQTGLYTQENDTRLKNPKSEFVCSQTLSRAAIEELGLFSEENKGLETQGKEYLKRKYGVASYPEHDLRDLLPGEIPSADFSKTKAPANQVQFTTYQSYIESFFRPFVNEDLAFLSEKYVVPPGMEKNYDPEVSPYLIPKLGQCYTHVWAEEDATLGSKLGSPSYERPPLESYKPKGDGEDLVDDKMLTEDVSCGPLSSRLLSAILSIHEVKDKDDEDAEEDVPKREGSFFGDDMFSEDAATQLNAGDTYKVTSDATDFYLMEERLKRELKYIGIFMNLPNSEGKSKKGSIVDSDDWLLNREDDEICSEIRVLQEELKGAVTRNRRRKKALGPLLNEQLAYQEYCTILEDLDKQVDQAYMKRTKAKNKKKKIGAEMPTTAQQLAANSGLKLLLEKRTRWISNIGRLFLAPELMKRAPTESVFENQEQSDDEDAEGEVEVVAEE